jgi:hypothetical protein
MKDKIKKFFTNTLTLTILSMATLVCIIWLIAILPKIFIQIVFFGFICIVIFCFLYLVIDDVKKEYFKKED